MKAGVSTGPLRVSSRPDRASEPASTTRVVNRTGESGLVSPAAGVHLVKPIIPEALLRPESKADPAKSRNDSFASPYGFLPVTIVPVSVVLQFQAERAELLANLVERS